MVCHDDLAVVMSIILLCFFLNRNHSKLVKITVYDGNIPQQNN